MSRKILTIILCFVCLISLGAFASCLGGRANTSSSHEHTYSPFWSKNDEYHWKVSDCEHAGLITQQGEHIWEQSNSVSATFTSQGYIDYTCSVCDYTKREYTSKLEHNYSSEWSSDEVTHWHACTDTGYEYLKKDESAHTKTNQVILSYATADSVGRARYTCGVCEKVFEADVLIEITINSLPQASGAYIGQELGDISLNGGSASIDGTFEWANPNQIITQSQNYAVNFVPTESSKYQTLSAEIFVSAEQLTATITVGEGGTSNHSGVVNLNYGDSLELEFTPNENYEIDTLVVNGKSVTANASYTLSNITANASVSVTFKKQEQTSSSSSSSVGSNSSSSSNTSNLTYTVTFVSGTAGAYTATENLVTFTSLSSNSVYAISGTLNGNIVIDIGENYKLDLEFTDFTLTTTQDTPILILSGKEVALQAKVNTQNYIYDKRDAVASDDTTQYSGCVYSMVDMELGGKGSLTIISDNNNGVHAKDDLQVKNLNLYIKSVDNCLKGNDSVTLEDCTTTLISRQGDAIKTVNSHINSTTGNQKGSVTILGGTHNIYAACDGIDSSYNVVIENSLLTNAEVNIYTDQFSEYSEEITTVSSSNYYLRYSSSAYTYSVYYFNSSSDYKWVNVSTTVYSTVSGSGGFGGWGGSSTYYFYTFEKLSDYSSMIIYMYSSSQTQGQSSSYYACSGTMSVNQNYDTLTLSYRNNSLSASWTSYESASSSSSQGGMGNMGGGMQEGNANKSSYSTKAIKSANDIIINDGTIFVKSYDDAIHAGNFVDGVSQVLENGEYSTGNITFNGGSVTAYSYDDGLHADGKLSVVAGTISVTGSYEGVEGYNIVVSGGNLSVVSSDDGFNSTATSGAGITISGGKVYILAGGDGLDSNSSTSKGAIIFSGGDVVVFCTSGGNAAIDCDGGYTHNGGRVIALTSTGGMTSECTNGNSTGMTVKSSLSLSNGGYLTVTVSGSVVATVKMPTAMSAHIVYLGSSSATISSATSSSASLDGNGVCWN